jgi:DNA-binding NarL/FixJ family response regulator
MRVLIADDSLAIRLSLRTLLNMIPGVEFVGEATNGQEAVEMVALLRPDIVLMDALMPGINGVEATSQIVEAHPETRVLMLSIYSNEFLISESLKNGANGFLPKTALLSELSAALEALHNGEMFIIREVAAEV